MVVEDNILSRVTGDVYKRQSIAISFVAVQVALMMYITFQIRDIYYNGSLVLIFLLLLAQGFCGMGAGE